MKKLFCSIFAVILIATVFAVPSFAKNTAIKNVNDARNYEMSTPLIYIRNAGLYLNGKTYKNVYLISLGGSNMSWDKQYINCMQTCLRSGVSIDNVYLQEVKKQAKKQIPSGSNVILMGHSLGGMVAQQFAADKEMKDRYNIINVLTMGSPYIVLKDREGDLHRMADSGDAVPFLSSAGIANAFLGNFSYERCGYFGNPDKAHNVSYGNSEKWQKYDCLGVEGGNSRLVVY